ncbi:hypothetical protein EAX61_01025 [Dokdonia sinensis]|uniref:Lipocalin-like domain-containing protein n=1 Tax=Dokdonia sinensis TaxID=2479847 RepID=A0A3M0GGD8_9FLAO|nr:lipocalin family protein [Dokdonia sinensis]RMB63995.1 hypothetical protein EAX61_01025 [Dokdonia sinensis]
MKNTIYILLLLIVSSCTKTADEQLELINGYWEIASVENPNGDRKEYTISENIDFIQIENGKGVRKKVRANLIGDFKTTNAQENIDVATDHNRITLRYSTAYDTWNETVVKVTRNKLVVQNDDGLTYTYRRYEPLSID